MHTLALSEQGRSVRSSCARFPGEALRSTNYSEATKTLAVHLRWRLRGASRAQASSGRSRLSCEYSCLSQVGHGRVRVGLIPYNNKNKKTLTSTSKTRRSSFATCHLPHTGCWQEAAASKGKKPPKCDLLLADRCGEGKAAGAVRNPLLGLEMPLEWFKILVRAHAPPPRPALMHRTVPMQGSGQLRSPPGSLQRQLPARELLQRL